MSSVLAAFWVTHLTDGAHGSHVALIAGAELGGRQQPCGVQAVQASVDGDFTHCPQVTVAPDLKLWRVFAGYPGRFGEKGKKRRRRKKKGKYFINLNDLTRSEIKKGEAK